jgi:hypothetical protein
MATGETKSSTTGRISPIRGNVKYGQQDASDTITRFVRSKLSPAVGTAVDLATGKNAVGQEVTPGSAAQNLVTPLGIGDVYAAMKELGVAKGTAVGLLALFGMGAQTYKQREPARPHH